MSKWEIDARKIIAIVLLVLEVIAIIFSGYIQTINETGHYGTFYKPKDNLYLTFSKDIPLDKGEEEVIAPKGSVVLVEIIGSNYVGGYYSKTNDGFDDYNKMDYVDWLTLEMEKGVFWFHLSWDCFEEQTKIRELYSEAEQSTRIKIERAKTKIIVSTIVAVLCCLLVGALLIFLLSKVKWFVLLYVLQIIILFIMLFIWPGIFLWH